MHVCGRNGRLSETREATLAPSYVSPSRAGVLCLFPPVAFTNVKKLWPVNHFLFQSDIFTQGSLAVRGVFPQTAHCELSTHRPRSTLEHLVHRRRRGGENSGSTCSVLMRLIVAFNRSTLECRGEGGVRSVGGVDFTATQYTKINNLY